MCENYEITLEKLKAMTHTAGQWQRKYQRIKEELSIIRARKVYYKKEYALLRMRTEMLLLKYQPK